MKQKISTIPIMRLKDAYRTVKEIPTGKRVHYKRLEKLASFLHELPKKKFYFGTVVRECGAVCCAIGWTPLVFPKLVSYSGFKDEGVIQRIDVCMKTDIRKGNYVIYNLRSYIDVGAKLFGISSHEARVLFSPFTVLDWDGYRKLGLFATPKQVARSIRKFIAWKKKGNAL